MIYLKEYNSYREEKIISEGIIVYSDSMLKTLNVIDSNLSRSLIYLNNQDFKDNNILFVDILDKDNISYISQTKTSKRNQSVGLGRMLTKLISLTGQKFTDKEKETFINKFKALLSFSSSVFKKYEGDDIYEFYSLIEYDKVSGLGQLGKSCMNKKPKEFFDLYTKNPNQVKILVLERDGEMIGRCLLWSTDNGFKFMDRIYTYLDTDIELFKLYGDENGFWYKELQNTSYMNRDNFNYKFNIRSKDKVKSEDIIVSLDNFDFDYYPYLDSLCYFNSETGKLSNHRFAIEADLLVCNLDGGYKKSDFEWVFE
jgi:hypothetical protein